jgi:hypothetical protein
LFALFLFTNNTPRYVAGDMNIPKCALDTSKLKVHSLFFMNISPGAVRVQMVAGPAKDAALCKLRLESEKCPIHLPLISMKW